MDDQRKYPEIPDIWHLTERIRDFANLKSEYGADPVMIERALNYVYCGLSDALRDLIALPEDSSLAIREPNALEKIRALRPQAARRLWERFDEKKYASRLAGAFLGRMAGCTLGAPVEFWSVEAMRDWAAWIGDAFPPGDYWSAVKKPSDKRYIVSIFRDYTRAGMDGAPADDDIAYTLLGLMIAEEYSLDFTTEDVGKCWVKYLPLAYTAEEVALKNLKSGMSALEAADHDNPFAQWIGADIRSDPWGYLAPGLPEKAAGMAWRDAFISHRRNGIYGEMYFSAAIAAAFTTDSPIEALWLGLNEIPIDCMLAQDIRWALDYGKNVTDYAEARRAVEVRFGRMSGVHTNLNACLTVFGLMIGGDDFGRCIGETVAMGYDNDCTAATAGSIFGAARGIEKIPERWYSSFNNRILTYFNGHREFAIDDVLVRFAALAQRAF